MLERLALAGSTKSSGRPARLHLLRQRHGVHARAHTNTQPHPAPAPALCACTSRNMHTHLAVALIGGCGATVMLHRASTAAGASAAQPQSDEPEEQPVQFDKGVWTRPLSWDLLAPVTAT